jgi:S-adenosylmethionine-diacylglycerol 3-amino-3-carboxypropyl transferase
MVQEFVGGRAEAGALVKVETLVPTLYGAGAVTWAKDSILFSSCNEDSAGELRAFGDLTGKRVLCITAGGGRVLNLLLGQPDLVWAVDLNPAQNYLLELKVAGMRALDHTAYLRFLGVRACTDRLVTYAGLREMLSSGAQRFFAAHPRLVQGGVLLQGKLERYLRRVAIALRLIQPFGVRQLFSFDDIEEQRHFVGKVDTRLFRAVAEIACSRGMLRLFSGDPGFYRYVPSDLPLHRVIYDGILEHFRHYLARDNPLMQLVFFGRWINEAALPIYLNARTYDRVKAGLERARLVTVTSTVNVALAEAGPARFDAFSLSDISSYLDDSAHTQLFDDVLTAARPGARLCSRSNIHHRPLSPEQARRVTRDLALERELSIADHSCVHKFVLGELG